MKDKEVKEYILYMLQAFGQMDHISGKVEHTCKVCKTKDSVSYHINNSMQMPVSIRQNIIRNGFNILKAYFNFPN